ncbi:MAG: cysteine--tRNA ligase, partial [Halanaerobiales bacterium]
YCNATDHIEEMQDITEKLLEKGYAYEKEGSVYFDVRKFSEYGKLSGRKIEDMEAGSRVEVSEEKKHPLDFALWKKVEDEEPTWESPWGKGWPGWHIECSAMSMKYLGNRFDIHGGGTDLIFPHHENEIAQSEACSGEKPFVKYWLHNGTVNLKGEKMSKSVGNFFTTRELLQKYDSDVIRYFVLGKHYHSPIDFSLEELDKAEKSLSGLQNTLKTIRRLIEKEPVAGENQGFSEHELVDLLKEKRQEFEEAMDNDFNTARGLAVIHELATKINTLINDSDFKLNGNNIILLREADNLFRRLTGVLGLKLDEDGKQITGGKLTEDLIDYILKLREEAREQKNFDFADRIRDDLDEMGIVVRDGPQGVIWDFKKEEQNGD